jgi:hypothetical protein
MRVDRQEIERDISEVAELAGMTVEEVEENPDRAVRFAQKEIATQRRFDQANTLLRNARDSQRAPGGDPHPDRERATEADPDRDSSPPNQEDDGFKEIIQDIQFGHDPEEAAGRLRDAIDRRTSKNSRRVSLEVRVQNDFDRTMEAYEDVKSKNAELFADPVAEAAMERILHDGYRDDLIAAGFPEEEIPRHPGKRADTHRLARVSGARGMRTPEKLLADVKDSYVDWRDGKQPQRGKNNPAPQRESQSRVVIDRGQRRQAIPQQPTRSATPPRVPAGPPQRKTRQEILADMRKRRGQGVTAA